ncbi:MAG TPA: hypothetical protein P5536_04990 [Methanoregulaceae archaeon]|nr:hypothetical protein [Methanoregulaceae archaeon]HRT15408.1 hypothetical protein [Methanoregulaceae archaeon]HRU30881.1 hypothetical protein [Methanoregulaceae archaeon]
MVGKVLSIGSEKVHQNGGIMVNRITLVKIVFVLLICTAITGSAAATGYSVSVSAYGNGLPSSQFSPSKLSVLKDYAAIKGTTSAFSITGMNKIDNPGFTPSQGSVSAYSKMNSMQKTDKGCIAMEISDRVSMSGSIYTFDYTISFF